MKCEICSPMCEVWSAYEDLTLIYEFSCQKSQLDNAQSGVSVLPTQRVQQMRAYSSKTEALAQASQAQAQIQRETDDGIPAFVNPDRYRAATAVGDRWLARRRLLSSENELSDTF